MEVILDYFSVDWEDLLKTDELHIDNSAKIYLNKINILLHTYLPLKKLTNTSWNVSLNLG